MTTADGTRPSRAPALLLGLGPCGFFDGIVLHQIGLAVYRAVASMTSGRPLQVTSTR